MQQAAFSLSTDIFTGPPTENNALSGTVRAQTELYEKKGPFEKRTFHAGKYMVYYSKLRTG